MPSGLAAAGAAGRTPRAPPAARFGGRSPGQRPVTGARASTTSSRRQGVRRGGDVFLRHEQPR